MLDELVACTLIEIRFGVHLLDDFTLIEIRFGEPMLDELVACTLIEIRFGVHLWLLLRPLRSRRFYVGAGMKKRSVLSCPVQSAGDRIEVTEMLDARATDQFLRWSVWSIFQFDVEKNYQSSSWPVLHTVSMGTGILGQIGG